MGERAERGEALNLGRQKELRTVKGKDQVLVKGKKDSGLGHYPS